MVIKKTTKQQLHQENKPNTPLNNQKGHIYQAKTKG